MAAFKVFVSHGTHDLWLAQQIGKEVSACGAVPFLDDADIPKGASNFKTVIRHELTASRELVALFTPWSASRSWVWIELGAAWNLEIPILAVFYGMTVHDLDARGQGKAILEDVNVVGLNELPVYLRQLEARVAARRE